MKANEHRLSSGGDENVLKLIVCGDGHTTL